MHTDQLFAAHAAEVLARTRALLTECGYDALVLRAGNPVFYASDDQEVPFRPLPHFARFVPLQSPHHALIITHASAEVVQVIPEDFWEEQGGEDDFWQSAYTVRVVRSAAEADKAAAAVPGRVATLDDAALRARMDSDRALKTEYEVACIAEANRRSAPGHTAAQGAFMAGKSEMEIYHEFLRAVGDTEDALAYPPIVALNEKGATLHYRRKRTGVKHGTAFLIDAGARYLGYAADITRTYAGAGAHPLFATLIGEMDALQQRLVAATRPGAEFIELHDQAHRGIAEILNKHGIITADAETAIATGVSRAFFPHGLGHLLGLQVHDVGNATAEGMVHPLRERYPSIRTNRKLEAGMVTTIEPGLYFIPLLLNPLRGGAHQELINWKLVDELIPMGGIRIEDNVHVTDSIPVNLTRSALE